MSTIYNHTADDRTPYTYLLGWTKYNKWYYGVRYAKGCHPDDLWVEYPTSSEYVHNFVKEYGEPDIKQIRKIFESVSRARIYECKVLMRLNAALREDFLNQSAGMGVDNRGKMWWHKDSKMKLTRICPGPGWVKGMPLWFKRKMSEAAKKRVYDEEYSKLMSRSLKGRKMPPVSVETRRKISEAQKGKSRNFIWITDGVNNKQLSTLNDIPDGWRKGRIQKPHTEESKRKMSISQKGKIISKEQRQKISEANKNAPIIKCPYCSKEGKGGSMFRWHFEKCKFKIKVPS